MQHGSEIRAGVFVLTALVLFTIFIWVLGSERQMFAVQKEFHALFKDVKGLAEGAPVRLGGITIGRVSRITFSTDYRNPNINVTLLLNEDYLERIRDDSLVSIETQGLLGDRFVNISMASQGRPLPSGSTLRTVEPADIAQVFQKAQQIVDNTVKISENINKFIGDEGEKALTNISRGAKSLAEVLEEIETGSGALHNLVYREDDGAFMKNINSASADVSAITSEIRGGDGFLHALIFDKDGSETKDHIKQAAKNLGELSGELAAAAREIKTGKGLLHELIFAKSPSSAADLFVKLNQTAENLRRVSEALANGSGTLGALLIDPQLYDNMVEITDGARRSFLLRQAIRSSMSR